MGNSLHATQHQAARAGLSEAISALQSAMTALKAAYDITAMKRPPLDYQRPQQDRRFWFFARRATQRERILMMLWTAVIAGSLVASYYLYCLWY